MSTHALLGRRTPARPGAAHAWDRLNRALFVFSAAVVALTVFAIILFLGLQGLAAFRSISPLEFFLSTRWQPPEQYGAATFIAGSLAVTALALLVGAPLGLAGAIVLSELAGTRLRAVLRPAVDLFVGIPSVVYGWIGLTIFVPFIRDRLAGGGSGFGLLAAGVILGIMILPTVTGIAEDALRAVPRPLVEGSLALGATRWQTIWRVLVPAARPGILAGIILAMARAIGETMAVQMVIGNSPRLPVSLWTPTATLTSEIVTEMGNAPYGTPWADALFFMAFLLLLISLGLILAVRALGRRAAYASGRG